MSGNYLFVGFCNRCRNRIDCIDQTCLNENSRYRCVWYELCQLEWETRCGCNVANLARGNIYQSAGRGEAVNFGYGRGAVNRTTVQGGAESIQ